MAVLAHEKQLVGRRCRDDREGRRVLDDVDALFAAVGERNGVRANAEDAPLEEAAGAQNARYLIHGPGLGGTAHPRLVASLVAQRRSSVPVEIAWLIYFLFVFVSAVYLLLRNLVPRHFNDKIAIALAAIVASLIMIGTRAWVSAQWRRG